MKACTLPDEVSAHIIALRELTPLLEEFRFANIQTPEKSVSNWVKMKSNGLNMMRLLLWTKKIGISENVLSADTEYPVHQHPGHEIVLVIKGRIEMDVDGKKVVITDCGKPYYFDAQKPHTAKILEDTELIAITIPGDKDWRDVIYG